MASVETEVTSALDKAPGTPTAKRELAKTLVSKIKALKDPANRRAAAMRAELAQFRPVSLTLLTSLGGGIAEPVRRNLVGRFVTKCGQQGAALILLGGGFQWLGKYLQYPVLGPVGAAHCAYGGALVSASLYGSKDEPDPVVVAIEGTAYKSLHPAKEK